MPHYIEYTPAPTDAPDDDEYDGVFAFICDCPPTEACRWTSNCDCETWSLDIAKDGSWATHTHYNPDFDFDDEESEEEITYPMTVVEGPHCNAYWWFDESDFRDWALPPREGRREIFVKWVYDYYDFGYVESASKDGA